MENLACQKGAAAPADAEDLADGLALLRCESDDEYQGSNSLVSAPAYNRAGIRMRNQNDSSFDSLQGTFDGHDVV
jgi:hypothetical protein